MSTENSVTPPVESDPQIPESTTADHSPESPPAESPPAESPPAGATTEPQPVDEPSATATSDDSSAPAAVSTEPTVVAPTTNQPSTESASASTDTAASTDNAESSGDTDEPRRRVQLNPTLSPNVAKPVPSIASQAVPSVASPPQSPTETAPSDSATEAQRDETPVSPAEESTEEQTPSATEAEGQDHPTAAHSESATPPAASEPVALPPKDEKLDADMEAQLEAMMSGDAAEAPTVTSDDQADALAAGTDAAITDEDVTKGTRLKGTVQSIHGDDMLIDFGLRYAGILSRRQFGLRKQPMQGEPIEVIVSRIDENEGLMHVNLPSSASKVRGNWDEVSVDQIVECVVNQTNKGGLEVSVGSLRAFMPASQVELGYVADLTAYVGQKLKAHVTEVNPKRRKLVLSRRKLLEESREQTEKEFFEKLAPGQTYEGKVKTLKDYGAFVDIGGVDGLLHVGQISWSRINHPSEVLTEGQMIEVKVLSVDQEKKKIGLGMRQMTQNPWRTAEEKFPSGAVVNGKVTRIEGFGGFIELEPGIEGLVHISELDHKRVKTVHEVLRVGQEVDVKVIEVTPGKKRISLSLKALKEKPEGMGTPVDDAPPVQHADPKSLKGGTSDPTGGRLFGDPKKFGG